MESQNIESVELEGAFKGPFSIFTDSLIHCLPFPCTSVELLLVTVEKFFYLKLHIFLLLTFVPLACYGHPFGMVFLYLWHLWDPFLAN